MNTERTGSLGGADSCIARGKNGRMHIVMNYDLAMAAGTDAANRLMRQKFGRGEIKKLAWDADCQDAAYETFHRLYAHNLLASMNGGVCPECSSEGRSNG